jgi:cell division protein FtsW (lipid II flippase)
VLSPLLGFNIGIELGQLMIVAIILSIAFFFMRVLKVQHRDWNLFVSGAAAGMSLMLMAETKFW